MFRSIFAGLKKAFSAAMAGVWSLCDFVLCLPFRLLGIGAVPVPTPSFKFPPLPLSLSSEITPAEIAESLSRESHQAFSFAACCVLDGRKPEFPSAMSRRLRSWLRGLRYDELALLAEARPARVLAHLRGDIITGVPRLQPLPAADLVVPPEQLGVHRPGREHAPALSCVV